MVDVDTFLTTLYAMADDFGKAELPPEEPTQPAPSLARSEVVTLTVFGQWARFRGERDFYRFAARHLRGAFPTLPDRSQFNRLERRHWPATAAFFVFLGGILQEADEPFENLDGFGVATRNAQRRGAGWLAGQAAIGHCNRLGWYEGLHVLTAATRAGVLTGVGVAPANTKDQPLAETFLALRRRPDPRVPGVGRPARGAYVADNGFEGEAAHARWEAESAATVICPPGHVSRRPWPPEWRRWLAGLRQTVETAHGLLLSVFRLETERPHALDGFQARLAAKAALYNFCIWLNRRLGRPNLAFADLIDW
jgi:hypothetical protein